MRGAPRLLGVALAATLGVSAVPRPVASVSGRVVDQFDAPLSGARVRALDDLTSETAETRTDPQGRFVFAELVPGRYLLTATGEGFLSTSYGAMATREPGVPIRLDESARADDLKITLERPASISGRVADADGAAVSAAVHAMTEAWFGAEPSLSRVATARTDRNGRYALSGLTPGAYVLLVMPFGEPGPVAGSSHVPAFYPGVSSPAVAARVTVSAAEAAEGLDIAVTRAPLTSVTVTVEHVGGRPLVYASLMLEPEARGQVGEVGLLATGNSGPLRPMSVGNVHAGRYRVTATALEPDETGVLERLWASRIVDVDGRTPLALTVELGPAARLDGHVVWGESGEGPSFPPPVWLWPFGLAQPGTVLPRGGVLGIGTFSNPGFEPGRFVVRLAADATEAQPDWTIRRVVIEGRDLTDLPFDLSAGDWFRDVEVTLSDRPSELSGKLTDAAARPRHDVTLVVFSADSRQWWTGTRRVRAVRPDASGFYLIRGLPEGEYRLAAFDGRLPADLADPRWLSSLVSGAVTVLIADGSRTTQDLRIPAR